MTDAKSSLPGSQPRRRRRLHKTMFVIATLFTLAAAFYIMENWRGRRAWARYQQQAIAKGAQLDWQSFIPARVPDEQNFAKTPLLDAVAYRSRLDTNLSKSLPEVGKYIVWDATGDPWLGRKVNWPLYQSELRARKDLNLRPLPQSPAEDLLQALSAIEPQLQELRRASAKPFARFDIDRSAPFEEVKDFNFTAIRKLAQALDAHGYAALAVGQTETAYGDVLANHRLSDGLKDETTLVALMIRVAVQGLALHDFWEGWTDARWSDRQLTDFQELFARIDLLPEFSHVMAAERAGIIALVTKYGIEQNELCRVTMRNDEPPRNWQAAALQRMERWAWKLVPRGWVYQNLVAYSRRAEVFLQPSFQARPAIVSPARMDEVERWVETQMPTLPYGWMSRVAVPNGGKALQNIARVQTSIDQARIVCALERFKHGRGQYPATLSELAPDFIKELPVDVINGTPLKYQRTSDGTFLLYSAGWNAIDDKGTPGMTHDNPPKADFLQGDWVWRYPVKHRK